MAYEPCQNTSCASYGQPHPNCKCYAQGGAVCAGPHDTKCEHFADGGEVQANQEFQSDPGLAVDHNIAHAGLSNVLSKAGYTKSEEPGRAHTEFLDNHRRGRKALEAHTKSLLEPKPADSKPIESNAGELQTKLDKLRADPEAGLGIGGELDTHGPILAAKAASAATYLNSIKPKPTPAGPLDKPLAPSRMEERNYQRQLELAERPTLIYERIRNGTAVPADLNTLQTLYPKLHKAMSDRAFATLTDSKTSGRELSQKQQRMLGVLLGQQVSILQSPQIMQAIMKANAPQLPMAPPPKQKKASGVELKQLNRVDELSKTSLEKIQSSK
jgi:hypothetical protein